MPAHALRERLAAWAADTLDERPPRCPYCACRRCRLWSVLPSHRRKLHTNRPAPRCPNCSFAERTIPGTKDRVPPSASTRTRLPSTDRLYVAETLPECGYRFVALYAAACVALVSPLSISSR